MTAAHGAELTHPTQSGHQLARRADIRMRHHPRPGNADRCLEAIAGEFPDEGEAPTINEMHTTAPLAEEGNPQ